MIIVQIIVNKKATMIVANGGIPPQKAVDEKIPKNKAPTHIIPSIPRLTTPALSDK